jgi:hypothetical protein
MEKSNSVTGAEGVPISPEICLKAFEKASNEEDRDGMERAIAMGMCNEGTGSTRVGNDPKLIKNKFPGEPLAKDGKVLNYTIENGKIKGINGQREVDFIIDSKGNLVIGKKHTTLANGADIQAAGQLKLNGQGNIRGINNLSGHYRPTSVEAANYPELLNNNGLSANGATMELYDFITDADGMVTKVKRTVIQKIK